jgi:small subunit ribosomal protein S1
LLSSKTTILETEFMEQSKKNEEPQPDWYENFLDNYDYQNPRPGQVLEGKIIRMEDDGILVDIGLKRDALVPSKDLSQVDEEYLSKLDVGDQIIVYVLNYAVGDKELLVSLSKGLEHQSWEKAEKYMQEGLNMELQIIGYNRGGLIVKFETLRGFLPFSLVPEIHGIRSPKRAEKIKNDMVGTEMNMKIIEVARQRNRLIFSAAAALEEQRKERLKELEKGQIITGRVVSIVDFGAFVDLSGVDGLIHISQLDWKKVKHPSEVLSVGDEVQVKVINVDVERERISLSRKSLLPSPWETIAETLHAGDYVEGRVTRIVDFGAFVELPAGVEGLVHISQMGYSSSQDPKNSVKPGETVLLRVLEVHPDRKRVALSMRQVPLEKQIAWAMEYQEEPILTQQAPGSIDVKLPADVEEKPVDETPVQVEQLEEAQVEIDQIAEQPEAEIPDENLSQDQLLADKIEEEEKLDVAEIPSDAAPDEASQAKDPDLSPDERVPDGADSQENTPADTPPTEG